MTYRVVFLDRVTEQLAAIYLAAVEQGWDTAALNTALTRDLACAGNRCNAANPVRLTNESGSSGQLQSGSRSTRASRSSSS
ncbi:MAG TPA: hypothetical protein VL371_07855 [Gemmataceae bacterium]|jgi:hypothetical protein|nr:hypothetical protein [Gemmataceae bacterium]